MPRINHPPPGHIGPVDLMQNVNSSADDGHIAQDGARGHVALA